MGSSTHTCTSLQAFNSENVKGQGGDTLRSRTRAQTRLLLRALISDRLGDKPNKQTALPLPHHLYQCVSVCFGEVTDRVESLEQIKDMMAPFSIDRSAEICREVVINIFDKDKITMGRVLGFFSFAYELCLKYQDDQENILEIMDGLLDEFVIDWIVESGGWESVLKPNTKEFPSISLACGIAALVIGGFIIFKSL